MLILLNSYPLLVSQNLMVSSNQTNLRSTAKVIESALMGLEQLTEENVAVALTGLDDAAKARCLAAIDRAVGPQKTLVMACHDPAEAAALAARTVPVA